MRLNENRDLHLKKEIERGKEEGGKYQEIKSHVFGNSNREMSTGEMEERWRK